MEAGDLARQAEAEVLRSVVLTRLPEVYPVLGQIAAASGRSEAMVLFEQALGVAESGGLPDVERARTLEAYGEREIAAGSPETGKARLESARDLFRSLGCDWDMRRIAERLARANGETNGAEPLESKEG